MTKNPKSYMKARRVSNPRKEMLIRARRSAKRRSLAFNLTEQDIHIPNFCPILGLVLKVCEKQSDCSPSLDRIDNNQGYIKGNVIVVSNRVNRIKGDSSIAELQAIVRFYSEIVASRKTVR